MHRQGGIGMYLFIVNPVAGNGQGRKVWSQVEASLHQRSIPFRVEFTKRSGHAKEIARIAASQGNVSAVVAIGGDGTIHEVGNGLVHTEIPVGFIPAGSGNDFSLAQKVPSHPEQALEQILKHHVRRVDTADLGGRTMIGFAGIGFDGRVAETVNRSPMKGHLGRFNYIWSALQTLVRYQPTETTLTIDGKPYTYQGVWLIAINNTPYYGGGMKICPQAVNTDGLLDVCCVSNLTRNQFIRIFPSVFTGRHIHHPSITLFRGKEITITSPTQSIIHVDGEVIGKTPLSLAVQPQSLSVLHPWEESS